ncbi:MAG: hypothetical protein ACHQLQ_06385 [Candidatus Acidiferrales bacterium]
MKMPHKFGSYTPLAVLLISLYLPFGTAGPEGSDRATLHVRVVDHSGRDVGRVTIVEFKSKGGGRNLAGLFRGNDIVAVPFDVYHLRLYATGFYSAERDVPVFQSDVWVRVGLALGEEGGPLRFQLPGVVKTPKPKEGGETWVRLSGVYSTFVMDAKVTDSGEFAIAGIPQGIYVVTTTQKDHIVDVRPVSIPFDTNLVIDLTPTRKD